MACCPLADYCFKHYRSRAYGAGRLLFWNVLARKLAIELGFPQLKPTDVYEDNTASLLFTTCTFVVAVSTLSWSSSMFYTETHSGWINWRQSMPQRSVNCRHWNKSMASRTIWKLYGAASRRQARWRQMTHHLARPKPLVCLLSLASLIWFARLG